MGCHTWFYKDKEVYFKFNELDDDNYSIDEDEYEKNIVDDFHDIFRTGKRNDGSYPEDILTSYAETIDFLENPSNKNTFANSKHVYDSLKAFWYNYPNGAIAFG